MANDFLTVKEASQMLGISNRHLYRLTSKKKIPYYRPLGKLLFKREELQNLIERGRVSSNEEIQSNVELIASRRYEF